MPAAPASAAVPVSEPVPTVPALAPTPSAEPRPAATSGLLTLRTRAASWVEVQDANGQTLLSRHLQEGESVGLDGALPLRLTIGNASATQVLFRGQAVDLSPNTRDNVARMQLN